MPQSRRCYTYYNGPPRGTTRKFFGYFRTFLVFFFLRAVGIQVCFVECAVLVSYNHVQNDERCFLKLLISPKESKIVLFYLKILLTEI